MRECVLVVAQEMDLRARIARGLQSSGYAVELATDECRALRLASGQRINAAIVAPDSSLAGLSMARKLRDSVPKLLVLAERSEDMARLSRSLPEADAFLLKSSIEEELVGRLAELIIPTKAGGGTAAPVPTILWMEDCKLDLAARLFIDADGRELLLTRAECALLRELANNPGQIRSRDDLRHAVAGRGADPCERSIDMLVARLRQKIEPDSKNPRFIVTIPGAGYKLVASRQNGNGQHSGAEPERRQLTVLSCSLAGWAALAAKFDPEDLAGTMRDFKDCCTAVITRIGGTVSTRSTDEMLALFGYPEAHEDDAERAVHAGLDLVEKIGQLQSPASEPLQVRIGVATGLALVGPEEAVVGEPLVVAAGLRNLASSNSVLIAESTRKLLSRVLVCDDLARHQLTGASDAVNACRVTGRRTVESRFKAMRPQRVMRLVGREQELRQLLALWDRAKHGEGQMALVCGEAGIGKSHLCEFFLEHVVEESHATLRYQCSPHHPNSPFYPVISQLEQAMGFEQADTPDLKFDKLRAALSHTFEPTRETILLYAALLSITPQCEQSLGLTPKRQKDLIIATLIRHILSHADKQPLVIVLADAHWIDSSTLELVNRIIPLIKKARVLFLIKFRPDFKPKWLGEPHVTMLPLDRMGHEHSHSIISDVIGGKEIPREVEEEIIHKADGIPLFIEELTKSVMQSGWVQDVDNRCVVPGPFPTAVPASLLDSLTARLDRLGPAKEIAQIGAVIGREFSQSLLAAVAPDSSNSFKSALAQLKASELVFISCQGANTVYEFKHALLQEAAYATLPRPKRQRFHRRVAYALQNGFPLTIETQPELLAYHFGQAGLTERAVDYLLRAGRRSIEQSANVEAIGHLTRGLELLQGLSDTPERKRAIFLVEVMLGQAMIAAYGYAAPKTREILLRARMLIDDSTDLAQKFAVLYGVWASHYVAGETAKQQPLAVEFLAEAERASNTALQCIAHRIIGTTDLTMGKFAIALNHLKRARALYDSEHHASYRHQYGQDIGASALCYLSWTLWHLGYIDQASEAAAEAMKLAEKLSHPHTLVYTICHARGFMDLFRRRYEDIQSYADLVISICRENGFSHWMNCGKILGGWAAVRRGHVETGMEMLREGMVGWQKSGAGLWMPTFLMLEAEAYRQSGRDEAALQALERALAICGDSGERWAMAEVLRSKAHLLLSARRADDAEGILLKSLEIARRQQARCWELRTSCDLSRLWQHRGQSKKALKLLQSVYDQFTEGFDTADLRDAQKLLANLGTKAAPRREVGELTPSTPRTDIQPVRKSAAVGSGPRAH